MKFTGLKLNKRTAFHMDFVLLFAVLILVAFGIVMVYSASYYSAELTYGDKFFFMKKQLVGAVLGLVGMFAMYFVNFEYLKKCKWVAIVVSVVLLALVFVPGLSVTVYGATRWINLGFTTIQPSEIAKFGFIIFAACSLSEAQRKVKPTVTMT